MMADSSYDGGVDTDSVCGMVNDIYLCMTNRSRYVKMPVPLNHVGPVRYMEFIDTDRDFPADLSPRDSRTSGADAVTASIVARARFNIRDTMSPEDTRIEENLKRVTVELDEAMDMYAPTSTSEPSVSSRRTKSTKEEIDDSASEMQDMDDDAPEPTTTAKSSRHSKASKSSKTSSIRSSGTHVEIRGHPARRFTGY